MSRWLSNLNPEQREAVETIEGPLLVLAGAGSGKTRVITHRIAYMIDRGIDPEHILGVTFTNKAAEEMRQRLSGMVGPAAQKVTLSTFHALGLAMLRAEAARRQRSGRLAVFDTGDQLACLRDIGRRVHLERSLDLGAILTRISALKNAFVDPSRVKVDSDDEYTQAAALLYPHYQEQLEAYAAVDFDDLVCEPCRLMERSRACRARWSERYAHVLVDEYQDTNAAQLRMLRAIAGLHRNLCVVGDDDQSIYGWRGAQVENILRFEKDFPGAKVVYLERNYRSVGSVLALANAVIARNKKRHEKKLAPAREQGAAARLVACTDGDAEASWIANHIREALNHGLRPAEVAVLYRSNLFSRDLETALRAEGIHYRVLGGQAFFDSKEVKDLLAYLRVCAHPADEISLRRIINSPPRGIGLKTVAALSRWAEENGVSFHKALSQAEAVVGGKPAAAIKSFLELIRRARARFRDGRQLAPGLRALLDELQLEQAVQQSSTNVKVIDKRLAHLRGMVDGLRSYCERAPSPSLDDYLNRVALASSDADLEDLPGDRVTLSTLHGAKGLEFRLVILAGVEFYVGITRAMDELVLTRVGERLVRGKPQPRTPSRFLDGIGSDLLAEEDLCRAVTNEEVQSAVADLLAKLEG
jgi:DNA helicase-2/ATP-dependent DNA helicase PcrA